MLLRRSHDCGNGTYHDCGLINVNFVAGARNHYLPAVGRQLREIALQSHDYSQIRVPVLAFVGYPPLPEDQILANHITDPAERTIVYAVFGSNVGMIRKRIKRIEAAARGARVVDLWGANHFVFLSNETDVLREIRAFLVGLR